jgi:hypothetical protein
VVEENMTTLGRAGFSTADLKSALQEIGYPPAGQSVDHGTVMNLICHPLGTRRSVP